MTTRSLAVGAGLLVVLAVGAAPVGLGPSSSVPSIPSTAVVASAAAPLVHVDPAVRTDVDDRSDAIALVEPEVVSVVSAREGLDAALVANLIGIDGVVATARVRSATVGLLGSRDADGVPRDVLRAGYRIPVTVTALDPGSYRSMLADVQRDHAALFELLAPGRTLLSASSAALRGVGVGGTVDLGGAADLRIIGVVDDNSARGSEFLVHIDDADAIGLGRREALLVRHGMGSTERLADVVGQNEDDDVRLWHDQQQVRLVLSQVELKAQFGEFAFRLVPNQREVEIDRAFIAEHITIERMPVLGNVRCHRAIMDDLRAALDEVVAAGLEGWLARPNYGGCFHPRRIAVGRENLSRHSWGIAIDLNVDFSQPGLGPVPPDAFIAIMGRHGFRWGGDFATPDNHHFEWVGEAAQTRPARSGV